MINVLKLPRAEVDFETRSEVDIKKVGAYRYAQDPSTEIMCMSYKIGEKETRLWVAPNDFPESLITHVENGYVIVAFNVPFERYIWYFILHRKMNIHMPTKWIDVQASCAYRALPLKLEKAGEVLNLPIQKDKRGQHILNRLSKPRKPTKKDKSKWVEDWELTEGLYNYCIQDSDVEHLLGKTIGDLPIQEYRLWVLDQKINHRGVQIDLLAATMAKKIADKVSKKLTIELNGVTGGEIKTGGQVKEIVRWIGEQGILISDLQAATVEYMLGKSYYEELPPHVRRVLEIRQLLSKSSIKKLDKFLECAGEDGRARGLLQYHGAATGRWAGRLIQPQNFPRGDKKVIKNWERLFDTIKTGDADLLELQFGNPMEAISSALRGMIIAAPGNMLRVADFSGIEARIVMWVAGQQDALDAFSAYDNGEGSDIYCDLAQAIYNRPIDKDNDPEERGLGKVGILGCGYQMAWEKLQTQAKDQYGIILTDQMAMLIVDTYRNKYSHVVDLWKGLDTAAKKALELNKPCSYRSITYEPIEDAAGKWLSCILPNGRKIWYYKPEIIEGRFGPTISYEGKNSLKSGIWERVETYGGKLTENVVQAIARDFMAEAMIRVEKVGYQVILTVHDEIVSENLLGFGSQEEFEHLMSQVPPWAKGCPMAVDGWEGSRYKKG